MDQGLAEKMWAVEAEAVTKNSFEGQEEKHA